MLGCAARPLGWTRMVVFVSTYWRKCVLFCVGDVVGGFSSVGHKDLLCSMCEFYLYMVSFSGG